MADYISIAVAVFGIIVSAAVGFYVGQAGRKQSKQHHYVNLRATIGQELASRIESNEKKWPDLLLKNLLADYSRRFIPVEHATLVFQRGVLNPGLDYLSLGSGLLGLDPYTSAFFTKRKSLAWYRRNRNRWFSAYWILAALTVGYPPLFDQFTEINNLETGNKILHLVVTVGLIIASASLAAVTKRKVDLYRSLKFLVDL
ncbi:MAG: hypothetical protein HRU39_08930 [Salinicola sp.]|uniref:hypothetical protein n=1 Tax=Salinicola sp. TaxID=1978524 RepID=UPI001DAC2370|nr:hypothetical protein [Salinicola sp.]NRB56085.1 hypothetical protein [Salinicola sp.]